MGRGATATLERLAASLGQLNEALPRFAAALDLVNGGVVLALPGLLVCGLLRYADKYFRLPKGVIRRPTFTPPAGRDRRKFGGQAAIACGCGHVSLAGWNLCP